MKTLRIGTATTKLALIRSERVADALQAANPGLDIELLSIAPEDGADGRPRTDRKATANWQTSVLQDALGRAEVDLVVHTYTELATTRPPGLMIAAVPRREDARDALVSAHQQSLRGLPSNAVVGTDGERRAAQVYELRPDVRTKPVVGDLDTCIASVDAGEYDAIVCAASELRELGFGRRISHVFGFEELLPAPAQGALAIECRVTDRETRDLVAAIDDPETRVELTAERGFLSALEAIDGLPVAAHAELFGTTVKLSGLIIDDGRIVRSKIAGPVASAAGLGRMLAEELVVLAGIGHQGR